MSATSSAGAPTPDFQDSEADGSAVEAVHPISALGRKRDVPSAALAWRDEQLLVLRLEKRDEFVKHGSTSAEEKWSKIGKLMEAELQRQRQEAAGSITADLASPTGVPERVPVPDEVDPDWFLGKRLYDRIRRLDVKSKDVRGSAPACCTS